MSKNFKLGPTQKLWLKRLKENPDLQTSGVLGEGSPKNYKACCLGEYLLCYHRVKKKKLPFTNDNQLYDGNWEHDSKDVLKFSYQKLGLNDDLGSAINSKFYHVIYGANYGADYHSLAHMNDSGISWKEIAEIVENDPTNVFTKSV